MGCGVSILPHETDGSEEVLDREPEAESVREPESLTVQAHDNVSASVLSVASEYKQLLSALDNRLIRVLKEEDIRLLRVKWLLTQPTGYKIQRRQVLEALGRANRRLSPLLSGKEAVALIRNGQREVGALSYGWLLPWDPDPTGERMALLRRLLLERPYIKALFWDQATLYQPPRSQKEEMAFSRALHVMMDLYASAIGTTVLQIKNIPQRPAEYDGMLCLGGVLAGTDEKKIRKSLQQFGEIECCMPPNHSVSQYRVKFKEHSAAEQAAKAPNVKGLYDYAFVAYKSVPYDDIESGGEGRGWCICESNLAGELVSRLSAYPKMAAALASLHPKMLRLTADSPTQEIEGEASHLAVRVSMVKSRLGKGIFTSQSDADLVPALYEDYVNRIAGVLQTTLALTAAEAPQRALPAVPSVSAPVAAPLRLADGQLLLQLADADGRRAGGEGASQLSTVQGGRLQLLLAGGDVEVLVDCCSQVVLPWRAPAEGWAAAFKLEMKKLFDPLLKESLESLNKEVQDLTIDSASAKGVLYAKVQAITVKLQALVPTFESGLKTEVDHFLKMEDLQQALGSFEKDAENIKLQKKQLRELKNCAKETSRLSQSFEPVALHALRKTGAAGERRYASGQWLTVRQPNGRWADTQVSTNGAPLRFGGQTLQLCPWNHAPRELPQTDFEELQQWWMASLKVRHSHIAEALTGTDLDVLQQCVALNMGDQKAKDGGIRDAFGLSQWLRDSHMHRCNGSQVDAPAAALLVGPPAAGKTCLMSQVIVLSLDGELVPVLIKVQQLQRRLLDKPVVFGTAWNWVDAHLRLEYQNQPAVYRFLRQALLARRVLLLLDGLDEGGAKRIEIERQVTEVLAPQGHVMLCTSRPAGLTKECFAGFRQLQLSPLSERQQKEALEQRLGGVERACSLLEYLKTVPVDNQGQRVTSNPLMLSMFASVFELRQGVGMPETIAELYSHASEAMLARGGASSTELRRLMQAIFFEAHMGEHRVIEDRQLNEAALSLERPKVLTKIRAKKGNLETKLRNACTKLPPALRKALEQVRSRVERDELPLFSLLQTDPLQLQSSHLSFQEYFAARSLCREEGTRLLGPPPWQWSVWWANVVRLGSEMDGFGSGLLRAAGVQGDVLELSQKLGGDQPTVLAALCTMLKGSEITKLNLESNKLGPEGGASLAKGIKGNSTLQVLNLLSNSLGEGADAIVSSVSEMPQIISLCGILSGQKDIDLSHRRLGIGDVKLLAFDLSRNRTVRTLKYGPARHRQLAHGKNENVLWELKKWAFFQQVREYLLSYLRNERMRKAWNQARPDQPFPGDTEPPPVPPPTRQPDAAAAATITRCTHAINELRFGLAELPPGQLVAVRAECNALLAALDAHGVPKS